MKKRIALILAAVMVLSAIISGCNSGKDTKGGDTPAQKPADKQELYINFGSEPPSLDSAKSTDQVSFEILNNVQEGLTRQAAGYKIEPGIAEKWEVTPDGLNWTFHLRDAKWSDGKAVTSQDFKYAWLRLADPDTASQYNYFTFYIKGASEFGNLDVKAADYKQKHDDLKSQVAIDTPDPKTLKVTLTAPTPFWLGMMAFPVFEPERQDIVEKFNTKDGDKLVEKYAAEPQNMVYDGPFVISEWQHEDHIVLAKNANYWDASKVKLEKLYGRMVTDSNTAVQMYETGDLDMTGLSGANVAKYKADPNFHQWLTLSSWYFEMNLKDKFTGNLNFRKAISAAIDRKGMVDTVLANGSLPATAYTPTVMASGVEGKEFHAMVGDVIKTSADKAAAGQFWDAAKKEIGKDTVTLKLLTGQGDVAKRMVESFQAMIQDAMPGVKVEIEQTTFKVRLDRMRSGDFNIVVAGWGPDYNDPTTFLDLWTSDSPYNDVKWNSAAYDKALKDAEKNPDLQARANGMVQAEKVLMNDMPIIPIYWSGSSFVQRPYVKNFDRFAIGADINLKYTYVEGKAK